MRQVLRNIKMKRVVTLQQPEVKKMMEEVPHTGGEHKGPQQEGSHDNSILVEEDAEVGPSDVQQAVSGGEDPTEQSDYEKLRERDEALK